LHPAHLSGIFSKEDVSQIKADASIEAWYFCEFIAKAMGISIIFLGNEPKCNITRQYNEKMAELLPTLGVEVEIIPRISRDGAVISASAVRRLLKDGDFDGIASIVPPTTHRYLVETYGAKASRVA
jgi:citrate lyase synthetase